VLIDKLIYLSAILKRIEGDGTRHFRFQRDSDVPFTGKEIARFLFAETRSASASGESERLPEDAAQCFYIELRTLR